MSQRLTSKISNFKINPRKHVGFFMHHLMLQLIYGIISYPLVVYGIKKVLHDYFDIEPGFMSVFLLSTIIDTLLYYPVLWIYKLF